MKERKSFLVVLWLIIVLNGACSSEPGINKDKFAKLKVAAQAVKTSLAAGASYQQLADRVQLEMVFHVTPVGGSRPGLVNEPVDDMAKETGDDQGRDDRE